MIEVTAPFRRITDPFILPVGLTVQRFDVPNDLRVQDMRQFLVVNPNPFWVRLKGSRDTYTPVSETTGWLFPPGFFGVFSSQYPMFMSTLAVSRQGIDAGTGTLELAYGRGV